MTMMRCPRTNCDDKTCTRNIVPHRKVSACGGTEHCPACVPVPPDKPDNLELGQAIVALEKMMLRLGIITSEEHLSGNEKLQRAWDWTLEQTTKPTNQKLVELACVICPTVACSFKDRVGISTIDMCKKNLAAADRVIKYLEGK